VVRILISFLCVLAAASRLLAGVTEDYAAKVAPLIDPAKLATLGQRGANGRVQKAVYWLEMARQDKAQPTKVIDAALINVGVTNKAIADLTKGALLRNHKIATSLGCFDKVGLEEMRRGKSPTVQRGRYRGDELSVDHIIPRSLVPELDNVIANLELLPLKVNQSKNAKMGQRQRALADSLYRAGLLSRSGYNVVVLQSSK
jgi:hypothetical protein